MVSWIGAQICPGLYGLSPNTAHSNECKRRKIKCNGNTPCQRCGNLNLQCQYAPNCCANGFRESDEFRKMTAQMQSLQEQVDNLYANLNALRNGDTMRLPAPSERSLSVSQPSAAQSISPSTRYRPPPQHPSFRGPTSSAFSLDVAKNTLQNMGYQPLGIDEGPISQDPTPNASPPAMQPPLHTTGENPSRDPIWAFSKEEMVRLCHVYEEEMGLMYPVLDIEQVIINGTNLYNFIKAATRTGLADQSNPKGISDIQSCILKMVLAISTVVEGDGRSEIGYRLFESVKGVADRSLHSETIDIRSLPFLTLIVGYFSYVIALGHILLTAGAILLLSFLLFKMIILIFYLGYLSLSL